MCSDDPTHPDLQLMPPFHLVSCEFSPKDPNLLAGQHPPLLAGVDFAATQKFHTVFFYIIYNFRSACSFPFCDPFLVQNVHVPVLSVPIFLVSELPVPIDYVPVLPVLVVPISITLVSSFLFPSTLLFMIFLFKSFLFLP
jgi:hypothetical protein